VSFHSCARPSLSLTSSSSPLPPPNRETFDYGDNPQSVQYDRYRTRSQKLTPKPRLNPGIPPTINFANPVA
jgi:hypothetical protein